MMKVLLMLGVFLFGSGAAVAQDSVWVRVPASALRADSALVRSSDILSGANSPVREGVGPRVNVKLNGLVVVGIVNVAAEFRVHKNLSVQVEGLGIFANENFLGTGHPLSIGAAWGEIRYYPRRVFSGFFFAPHCGFGVYRLNKNIFPKFFFGYAKDPASVFVGESLMVGATLGWSFCLSPHWGLELSLGGGFQESGYEAYTPRDEGKIVHTKWNKSAEWLIYKMGVFVSYRF